jgi:hypothetical protein
MAVDVPFDRQTAAPPELDEAAQTAFVSKAQQRPEVPDGASRVMSRD